MENDSSKYYADEISRLKQKQLKIIKQERAGRKLKKSVEIEESTILYWPWYIYMILILIPFVIYLILKKGLTN